MRRRILFVTAGEMTARAFLVPPLSRLSQRFDVNIALNGEDADFLGSLGIPGQTFLVPIERSIRPTRDVKALAALSLLLRREKFDAVHSITPKAGLIAMTAAAAAGVPMRTHSFTGQVWATRTGIARRGLKALDRLTHRLSTFSLVDSPSQRAFLIAEGVLEPHRSGVLGQGSISGVDIERFRPDERARREVRAELGLAEGDVAFLYLGRLNRDKGVQDLARAFLRVREQDPRARLVIIGPDEGMGQEIRDILAPAESAVRMLGSTPTPERYMAGCDVFCLPSYREGFGSVLIEAGAVDLPVLASRIYGITDAVEEGRTGLLHPPGDIDAIAEGMIRLLSSPDLRRQLADRGLERARRCFSAETVAEDWDRYYDRLAPLS